MQGNMGIQAGKNIPFGDRGAFDYMWLEKVQSKAIIMTCMVNDG